MISKFCISNFKFRKYSFVIKVAIEAMKAVEEAIGIALAVPTPVLLEADPVETLAIPGNISRIVIELFSCLWIYISFYKTHYQFYVILINFDNHAFRSRI